MSLYMIKGNTILMKQEIKCVKLLLYARNKRIIFHCHCNPTKIFTIWIGRMSPYKYFIFLGEYYSLFHALSIASMSTTSNTAGINQRHDLRFVIDSLSQITIQCWFQHK